MEAETASETVLKSNIQRSLKQIREQTLRRREFYSDFDLSRWNTWHLHVLTTGTYASDALEHNILQARV
jgi:hypothetical protein